MSRRGTAIPVRGEGPFVCVQGHASRSGNWSGSCRRTLAASHLAGHTRQSLCRFFQPVSAEPSGRGGLPVSADVVRSSTMRLAQASATVDSCIRWRE